VKNITPLSSLHFPHVPSTSICYVLISTKMNTQTESAFCSVLIQCLAQRSPAHVTHTAYGMVTCNNMCCTYVPCNVWLTQCRSNTWPTCIFASSGYKQPAYQKSQELKASKQNTPLLLLFECKSEILEQDKYFRRQVSQISLLVDTHRDRKQLLSKLWSHS